MTIAMTLRKVRTPRFGKWAALAAALPLFAVAYLIINYAIIVESVLYRAAAHDLASAITAMAMLAAQAVVLLAGVALLRGPALWLLLALVAVSAVLNKGYSIIVGGTLDVAKVDWMLVEARQAGNAAGQFAGPSAIALLLIISAILLLALVSRLTRPESQSFRKSRTAAIAMLVVAPSILIPWTGLWPLGAERNVYNFAMATITRDPPPERRMVTVAPDRDAGIEKLIWLIDESIAYEPFRRTLAPKLAGLGPVDFGKAAAMGNCSTPSNVALRSGVTVRTASDRLDLRKMPTIWAYARKAGYRTTMIDGQASGAPQNMLAGSELALVDRYLGMAAGIDTDRDIARFLNRELQSEGRQFIYVVLKGVHFQYADHIPPHLRDPSWSNRQEYEAALAYSKKRFFDLLLDGVDRQRAAIIYTSDHGQNLTPGVLPHCSRHPVKDEFAVPMLAFLPPADALALSPTASGHSTSQIFPTSLQWMGYPAEYANRQYDNDLSSPTARYVWFGRNVVPVNNGDRIEISVSRVFPGD
jgi:glucan phosphoethanolaminetransferase (alkaline phosphatase superfamily)